MTNVTLVPKEENLVPASSPASKTPAKEEQKDSAPAEKKLPNEKKEIPASNWIMPPEQQGYIQANDRDCL